MAGYATGGANPEIRQTFAQGTAQRNLAAALILAILVFREESRMAIVLITGLFSLVPFTLLWWSMRNRRTITTPSS